MTVNNDTKVVLTSMEDEKGNKRSFEISYDAASLSEYVRDSYVEPESDIEKVEIPVLRVKGDCLEKVVDFMVHYHEEKMKDIPTPLGGNSFNEVMDQAWYQEFVSDTNLGNRDMLFDLLTAANFMGITQLLDLACLKVTFELTEGAKKVAAEKAAAEKAANASK